MTTCEVCGVDFKYTSHLLRHKNKKNPCRPPASRNDIEDCMRVRIVNGEYNPKHQCMKCKEYFTNVRNWILHSNRCRGVPRVSCINCLKSFKTSQIRVEHEKMNRCCVFVASL